ncbi:MAG: hypothetical protein JRG86_06060 [Deltaproteobacteria bacterium]|jgi:hypothetical protein|nr:hypothetical protein [Deltaproteobacteria bacterium]MBW2499976.1 hypothetical protein [Deltaproteobacteria bacterium]
MQEDRIESTRSRCGRLRRVVLGSLMAIFFLGAASPAPADDYNSSEAGHPVRIVAYVLHPVGVLLDYLLLRPAHWLASHEPLKTIFGHEEDEGRED